MWKACVLRLPGASGEQKCPVVRRLKKAEYRSRLSEPMLILRARWPISRMESSASRYGYIGGRYFPKHKERRRERLCFLRTPHQFQQLFIYEIAKRMISSRSQNNNKLARKLVRGGDFYHRFAQQKSTMLAPKKTK